MIQTIYSITFIGINTELIRILFYETLTEYSIYVNIHTYKYYGLRRYNLRHRLLINKIVRFTSKERKPNTKDIIFITKENVNYSQHN